MDVIYSYIGDKPFINGARGLSIARIISIESLKQHFTTDIVLADSCFEWICLQEMVLLGIREAVQRPLSPLVFLS